MSIFNDPSTRRPVSALIAGPLAAVLFAALAVMLPSPPAVADAAGRGGDYVPLSVTRVLDTRDGTGGLPVAQVGADKSIAFPVLGRAGVPTADVRAVMIDVTAIAPTGNTWLQVWPNGRARPDAAVVAAARGQVTSATAVVPVGADGRLALYNRWYPAHAAVDVHGYFTESPSTETGRGGFVAVPHTTVLDTRSGVGAPRATIPAKGSITLQVTGSLVPAGANAVALDLVVLAGTAGGWLRAYPAGGAPGTSVLDFPPGVTSTNAVVKIGAGGRITFTNEAGIAINLVGRAQGYFSASPTTGAGFRPVYGKLVDTRSTGVKVPANGTVDVAVGGMFGLPTRGIASAAVDLTIADQTQAGYLKAWPLGAAEPDISLANFPAAYYRKSLAFVPLGTDGKIRVRNASPAPANIDIDLLGYFADPLPEGEPRVNAPTTIIQAAPPPNIPGVGKLIYSFVDNQGLLQVGTQDPDSVMSLRWTAPSGQQFSGPPAIGQQADGRIQVPAQHATSNIWLATQTDATAPTWTVSDAGGSMATPPVVGTLPAGRLVLFAADADGKLWYNAQATPNGGYGGWRSLGDRDLVGGLAVVSIDTGIRLAGRDARGGFITTTFYDGGSIAGWTDLGTGLTGTPAMVRYPGDRVRVFATRADGTVVTKAQQTGGTFSATWTPLPGLTTVGSPSAVLSPITGKTEVVARDSAGRIWSTGEVTPASGTWRAWAATAQAVDPNMNPVASVTDPTTVVYTNSNGTTWAVVYRDADRRTYIGTPDVGITAATAAAPALTVRTLPAPE